MTTVHHQPTPQPRRLWLACLLSLAIAPVAATTDPAVVDAIARDGVADVLIEIGPAAPQVGAPLITDFGSKVAAVVGQLQRRAAREQAPVLAALQEAGVPHRSFWIANVIAARIDAANQAQLSRLSAVRRIALEPRLRRSPPAALPTGPKLVQTVEWGVQRVGAPALWARGIRGQGVVVAGQDTGYQWDHPALRTAYRGWNGSTASHHHHWHDAIRTLLGSGSNSCGLNAPAPCDDHGHGTHTMGTLAGDDGGANQIGVAPEARWIGCRNMERGNGTPSTYLECLQWFIAPTDLAGNNPDPSLAPHIINNSWGCPPSEGCATVGVLEEAVDNLRAAGILMVVAAGNSGSGCASIDTAPAPYASSFTVAASNSSDLIAGFSSRGPATVDGVNFRLKPDITGPGVSIRSSVRGGGYGLNSGTSMAAPHVAGAAALLMSAEPRLRGQPEAVEALLRASARPQLSAQSCGSFPGNLSPNAVFGHGIVDAAAAVDLLGPLFVDGFEAVAPVPPG